MLKYIYIYIYIVVLKNYLKKNKESKFFLQFQILKFLRLILKNIK